MRHDANLLKRLPNEKRKHVILAIIHFVIAAILIAIVNNMEKNNNTIFLVYDWSNETMIGLFLFVGIITALTIGIIQLNKSIAVQHNINILEKKTKGDELKLKNSEYLKALKYKPDTSSDERTDMLYNQAQQVIDKMNIDNANTKLNINNTVKNIRKEVEQSKKRSQSAIALAAAPTAPSIANIKKELLKKKVIEETFNENKKSMDYLKNK